MKIQTITLLAALTLAGCDKPADKKAENTISEAELNAFMQRARNHLVFMQGGEFQMGDFGEQAYGTQIDPNPDSKPLHRVMLTGYSMSQFKISNREYHFYLAYNHLPERKIRRAFKKDWADLNSTPDTPARVDWYDAADYCAWLGKITALPFALPTEAQWEYAARSGGKFLAMATDTGKIRIAFHSGGRDTGINIGTDYDREMYARKAGTRLQSFSSMPGDAFPPNAAGIYDMSANGWEWVKDWYDPEYYQHSPLKDPQGPDKPTFQYDSDGYQKVMRSSDRYNGILGSTVGRIFRSPRVADDRIPPSQTARCVVNLPSAVNY